MYKILILTGNVEERSLLYDLLQEFEEEFELYEAREKEEALRIIRSKNIQIVITDRQANLYGISEAYSQLEIIESGEQKDELKRKLTGAIHRIVKREVDKHTWKAEEIISVFLHR